MAEERLIDDDLNKDKKYRIRKNADGEDELYIDDSVQEEIEEFEAVSFDVPEFSEGDEELTPEQIAAAEQEMRTRAERIRGALAINLEKAQSKLMQADFNGALESADAALQIDPTCGAAWALKLQSLTKNFTDLEQIDDCIEGAENIKRFCSDEQKSELAELSDPLKKRVEQLEEQAAAMHVEVEQKKAERRAPFIANRNKAVKWFCITGVPFVACLIAALALAISLIDLVEIYGINLILTIVFAALTVIFFIASIFTSNRMWGALKKVSQNEKNSSTKLGRDYENLLAEIKKLNTVLQFTQKIDNIVEEY